MARRIAITAVLPLALVAALVIGPAARAGDTAWSQHYVDGMRSLQRGDLPSAEQQLVDALQAAEADGVSGQRFESLVVATAIVLRRQGKFEAAAARYEQAIEQRAARLGDTHLDVAQLRLDGAAALHGAGELDRALAMAEHALAARRERMGDQHARVAEALVVIGMIQLDRGDYEGAEAALFESELIRSGPQVARAKIAGTLSSLATARSADGDVDGAATLVRRAIAYRTENKTDMTLDNALALANDQRLLAMVSYRRQAFDDSLEAITQAMAITEQVAGVRLDGDAVYFWLAASREGHRAEAGAFLVEHTAARGAGRGDDWSGQMMGLLLDEVDAATLLRNAEVAFSPARETRLSEAHFLVGSLQLIDGRQDAALESFRRCVENGQPGRSHFDIATTELRRAGFGADVPEGSNDLDLRIAMTHSTLETLRAQVELYRAVDSSIARNPFETQWQGLVDGGYLQGAPKNPFSPDAVAARVAVVDIAGVCGASADPAQTGWVWNRADGMLYASGIDY